MMRAAGYTRPQSSLLLDIYSGASAAYSLVKLRTTYAGSSLRVRRSSDSTEQDIGFSGSVLDTTTLLSFCGAGDGFVTKWYDQSSNMRDLVQITVSNQPKIVSGGVVEDGILFDGVSDSLYRNSEAAFSTMPMTIISRVKTISRLLYNVIYNYPTNGWTSGYGFYVEDGTNVKSWNGQYNDNNTGTVVPMSSSWVNVAQVFSSDFKTYVDGSLLATDAIGAAYQSGAGLLQVANNGGGYASNIRFKHMIFFASDQASNMTTLNGLLI